MTKLKIGLWGCGGQGKHLAAGLVATGEAVVQVAHDVLPAYMEEVAREHGAAIASSAEALLSTPGLDGVMIALPNHLHADAAVQAAQAGLSTFLEKPMALSVADCRRIIAAARQNRITLMVGHVMRYYEPYRTVLRLQKEGRLGRLFAASIWRFGKATVQPPAGHWRATLAQSGGYVLEVGAHELDMLRQLLGRPQTVWALREKVFPRSDEIEDYMAIQIRFTAGGSGTYQTGKAGYITPYGFRLFFEQATLTTESVFKVEAFRAYGPDGQAQDWQGEFSGEDPVQAELRAWLAACRGEAEVPITGEDAMKTIALFEAVNRSVAAGQPVAYSL